MLIILRGGRAALMSRAREVRPLLVKNYSSQQGNQQKRSGPRIPPKMGAALAGGGTLLSLGLFRKKSDEKQQKPEGEKLPGADDLIIREGDMLYDNYLVDNAYNLLRRHRSSENSEILWRLARVLCEQGKLTQNAEEKKRLFHEALDYAEKALKNEPTIGSYAAHKWYAIILNYVTGLEGTKAQLARAMDVKSHLERSLEINSMDATTWHILGVWHHSFASLSTYERWGASWMYSKPPQTSYDEALRHFERAEAINPNFYAANNYYLGLCYEQLNRKEEALAQFKKAFVAPVITADDGDIHKKAFERLKNCYKISEAELAKEMQK